MATWDYIQKHVIVGNAGCGKSSLLVRLTDHTFLAQTDPTIGVEFGSKLITLPNGKVVKTHAWDTAGQESFRSITRSYYRGAEGALLCFDVTHRSSWTAIPTWLEDLRQYCEENAVITLCGNKVDLCEDGDNDKRQVSKEEAEEYAEREGLQYIETSAKSGLNVEDAFAATATLIHERIESNKLKSSNTRKGGVSFPSVNNLAQQTGDKVSGCC